MRRARQTLAACALAGILISNVAQAQSPNPTHPAAAAPMQAEYAVRWNIEEGGPRSAKDALKVLQQQAGGPDEFVVQYFDFAPPSGSPEGFSPILRERKKGTKKHELTFKYRGDHALSSWTCPFASPDERKEEVDVSVLPESQAKRAFSYSCTLESKDGPIEPPPALHAKRKSCTSEMVRFKAGKLKVEEWHLPGDIIMVEVSHGGSDTPADLDSFKKEVVAPLVGAGARPSDRSKTESGSDCPK
jgi:hypothetical protein